MHDCEPDVFRAALKKLPQRQADVLHLVFYQDLSISEASRVMNVSVGSSAKQVEQLVAAIESNLTARMALSDWESPTDFLLVQNSSTSKEGNRVM